MANHRWRQLLTGAIEAIAKPLLVKAFHTPMLKKAHYAAMSQIKAGKARPLAMFGAERSKALPDVPTMKELGYNIEYYLWVGMFAPKGTPDSVIKYMREALNKAAHSDAFKTAITNLGQDLGYQDQPEFARFWDADAKRIEDAVNSIGKVQG